MRIAEAVVNIALGTVLLWPVRRQLQRLFMDLPRRYAFFCAGLGMLLVVAHALNRGDATYPVTEWDMYTVSNPGDTRFVDYVATLSSGREERLLIGQLFPAGGRHLRARIDEATMAADAASDENTPERFAHLDSMMAAIARTWDTRHPSDSIRVVRIAIGTIPARDYRGIASITRRVVHEYRAP